MLFGVTGFILVNQLKNSGFLNPEHLLAVSVCDQPLKYKIGDVDPKFGISKDKFAKFTDQATQIWEKDFHKNLFEEDPTATLTVNLVFDNRQSLSNQITDLQSQVETDEQSLKDKIKSFQLRAADFKARLEAFNQEVESWNQRGGAPKEVYEQLLTKQQDLKQEGQKLNLEAKSLNQNQDVFKNQINQLNQTIDSFNEEIQKKPEEGVYDGPTQRIEIYFNKNQDELIHTLAHELGHGLGMDHNENPKSIMYSFSSTSLHPTQDDQNALMSVCSPHGIWEVIWENIILKLASQNKL